MTVKYTKLVEFEGLSAGATARQTVTFDEAGTIKYVFAVEKAGGNLTPVFVTLTLGGKTYTRDSLPSSVLGGKQNEALELGWSVDVGSKLDIAVENRSTSTVNVYYVICVE